jgi:hypothetical protein
VLEKKEEGRENKMDKHNNGEGQKIHNKNDG